MKARRRDRIVKAAAPAAGGFKWRDLVPAAALLLVGLIGLVAATLAPTGRDGQYVVVAPPWYDLPETLALIRRADGGIVDAGGPDAMVIVHSDDPGFIDAAYRAGAWAVIDPMRLRGCVGFRPASTPAQGG
ncbi:hypothetical protein [Sphingomonas colocasiae]|uniref:Uncharacterized protein n=1 Tax=Sphingomonas colocasiae TaxID=1848973 RepID=A0ABS7PJY4_9SPHN|nr:hypothetical protein [Sphingomonas colocasiae]MBY8821606.1 hypothetical protein [Sphingomonas colocasiae]